MKDKNVFYEYRKKVTYNDNIVDVKQCELHYGKLPEETEHLECADYDTVVRILDSDYITVDTWYVCKPFLSRRKYVYETSWYESFKIKPRHFKKLVYDWKYVEVKPSLKKILSELPIDELKQWLKDNKLTISDISKEFGKSFGAVYKDKKILVENK